MKSKYQLLKVLGAIALGICVGLWSGTEKTVLSIRLYDIYDVAGALFINALTLIVVPLVLASIISGVAKIGGEATFKRLGKKTFSLYVGINLLGVLIGVFFVNVVNPGLMSQGAMAAAGSTPLPSLTGAHGPGLITVLMKVIPPNLFEALTTGNLMGIIFFGLLFGYAISKIPEKPAQTLQSFFEGIFHAMIRVTHVIIYFLPFGVFFLVAKAFATTQHGFSAIAYFFATVMLGNVALACMGLPLLIKLLGRVSPWGYYKDLMPAMVTAFSTTSSSATLPVTLDCVEKKTGISNRIASLIIPLGTSLNMAGSAMYNTIATLFVMQAYGIELTLQTQGSIALLAFITSFGLASIPSGGIVAIIVILKTVGIPLESIGLIIAIDRILDMFRTTVNVLSSSTTALIVARSEGEKTRLGR